MGLKILSVTVTVPFWVFRQTYQFGENLDVLWKIEGRWYPAVMSQLVCIVN